MKHTRNVVVIQLMLCDVYSLSHYNGGAIWIFHFPLYFMTTVDDHRWQLSMRTRLIVDRVVKARYKPPHPYGPRFRFSNFDFAHTLGI